MHGLMASWIVYLPKGAVMAGEGRVADAALHLVGVPNLVTGRLLAWAVAAAAGGQAVTAVYECVSVG